MLLFALAKPAADDERPLTCLEVGAVKIRGACGLAHSSSPFPLGTGDFQFLIWSGTLVWRRQ